MIISGRGRMKKANILPTRCSQCKKVGHSEKTCRVNIKSEEGKSQPSPTPNTSSPNTVREKLRPRTDPKFITCFNCQQKGHYATNCPHSALFCGAGAAQAARRGQVDGKEVNDILLDTGCSSTTWYAKERSSRVKP